MAPVRPRSLNCTQCGSPITVRNGFKAKTVACPACGSVLDLTSKTYEVLSRLEPGKYRPQGLLCLGMKGAMDEVPVEIVGRIRLKGSSYDDEDGWEFWYWDEWLVLTEKGNYYWIEHDEGKYTLNEVFTPTEPPPRDQLNNRKIEVDGETYRVKEQDNAELVYIEGELTWKARIGDTVNYLEAKSGRQALAIEWTEDEIEFFKCKRLFSATLFDIFQMEAHKEIHLQQKAFSEARRKYLFRLFTAVGIMGFASVALVCMGMVQGFYNPQVASGDLKKLVRSAHVSAGGTAEGVNEVSAESAMVWSFDLDENANAYSLHVNALMVPPVDTLNLTLFDPQGKPHPVVQFKLPTPGWGRDSAFHSFSAPSSGKWQLKATGTAQGAARGSAPAGYRLVPAPSSTSELRWTLTEKRLAPEFSCFGVFFLLIAMGVFVVFGLLYEVIRRIGGPKTRALLRKATDAHHQAVRMGEEPT